MDVAKLYADGGFFMGPILLCGLGSVAAGVVALAVHRNSTVITALVFAALCIALGYAGFSIATIHTFEALQHVPADKFSAAFAVAEKQINIPLYFGGACSVPGFLGGLVALFAVRRQKARG